MEKIDCEQSRRVVKRYKQGKLSNRKKEKLEMHVSQCPDCRQYFQEYQVKSGKGIKEWFAKTTPRFWGIVLIGCFCLTVAAFAFGGVNKAADWWKSMRMPTEDSLAEVEQYGIGNEVHVSQQDQGVEVTITHVIADDFQTFVYYEVEDHKEDRLLRLDYSQPPRINSEKGVFDIGRSYGQLVNGLNDDEQQQEGKYRGRIALAPIKEDSAAFDLEISTLREVSAEDLADSNDPYQYGASHSTGTALNGKWEFTIEADKEDIIEKPVNIEAEIEGNQIVIDQVSIGPTGTMVDYKYQHGPDGNDKFFYFDRLIGEKQTYQREDLGMVYAEEQQLDDQWVHEHALFKSMYRAPEDSLELGIARIEEYIAADKSFPIDPDKDEPQSFTFKGTEITVTDIKIDGKTSVTIKEDWDQDREFERVQYDIRTDPESMSITQEEKDGILVDEHGNEYDPNQVQTWDEMQKLRYFPLENTYTLDGNGTEEVKPIEVRISSYQKTYFPTETISLDL
ncbi:DUF4179 domain-containing protein [Sediminibacillus halophilus]|uniref:DUF4179 domain-containing protein n=1 Tax=Sediminibacillus halophilus TaxID=482461 RepID=A0A1G9VAE1_9BACI|nr:DUF4179 domain-containing protein [Sediminibacillus halophilus]SDM69139.1 protein of unknown function [Sediminibacillus halophilus]